MSNDKLVEKKDKTTNEPVQFYSANGGRTPGRNGSERSGQGHDQRLSGDARRLLRRPESSFLRSTVCRKFWPVARLLRRAGQILR